MYQYMNMKSLRTNGHCLGMDIKKAVERTTAGNA